MENGKGEKANRHPGRCHRCGERVGANAGRLVPHGDGWEVEHRECTPDAAIAQRSRWAVPAKGRTPRGLESSGLTLVDGERPDGEAYFVGKVGR